MSYATLLSDTRPGACVIKLIYVRNKFGRRVTSVFVIISHFLLAWTNTLTY
jgi:hypothetical protein